MLPGNGTGALRAHVPAPHAAAARARSAPGAGRFERAAAVGVLLLFAWLLLPVADPGVDAAVSGTAWSVSAGLAAWRCLRRARRRGPGHRAWWLLAAAATAWGTGATVWAISCATAGASPPFPSPADLGFLLFPPLAIAGLLLLPGLPLSATTRVRLLVDGAAATTALVLVAWLAGMAQVQGDSPAADVGRLLFVGLDVLAATLGLLVLDRIRPGSLPAARRAAAGVVVVVLSDVLYSALASTSEYAVGTVADALWCTGFLVLASAAGVRGGAIDDPRPGTRLLPLLPAAAAGVSLLLSGRLLTGLDPVLVAVVTTLGGALTARQVLLGLENAALHRSLGRKVAERTEQLQAAVDAAHRSARTDPLTGLPNREGFVEAVAEALSTALPDAHSAVLLVDLDRFQEINDGLGHDVGDTVLQAAARRLASGLRSGQLLGRLGGDEFGVLLTGLRGEADATAVAERLVLRMQHPLELGRLEVVVAATAGLASASGPAGDRTACALAVRELLRDADTALHAAKADGGDAVRVFVPEMHQAVRRSLQLQVDLRSALSARALQVHYQPVVDLLADRVVGVEALARWTHPTQGPVSPLAFIAAAERSGLVVELERVVLDTACAQLARWRRTSPGLTVAVNVSARHLRERDYLPTVMATLGRYALPPSALVLEVTESLLFHDDESARQVLEQLHTTGVGLALDDFGTGYSSLSRLVDYPFDTLKVDRSFVSAIDGTSGTAVLTATLAMARGLGMRVVAEGVETTDQLDFLADAGCELAQGYLLSRPGPAEVVGPALTRRLLPAPRQPR
ncbi:MAG TPA: EAL domain-containing protein [Mycobacteriales bacterium]|nr:EAL domain-containing protein [Mycobacteriales bacterium]